VIEGIFPNKFEFEQPNGIRPYCNKDPTESNSTHIFVDRHNPAVLKVKLILQIYSNRVQTRACPRVPRQSESKQGKKEIAPSKTTTSKENRVVLFDRHASGTALAVDSPAYLSEKRPLHSVASASTTNNKTESA